MLCSRPYRYGAFAITTVKCGATCPEPVEGFVAQNHFTIRLCWRDWESSLYRISAIYPAFAIGKIREIRAIRGRNFVVTNLLLRHSP